MISTSPRPEPIEAESDAWPIFQAFNHHVRCAGEPPQIIDDGAANKYRGYYVSGQREQWIFSVDADAQEGTLRSGDLNWGTKVAVSADGIAGGVLIDEDVRNWLKLCWLAATGNELKI